MQADTLTDSSMVQHSEHGQHDMGEVKVFGFWIYLMTDCILFACLFAVHAVIHTGTADGPSGKEVFDLSFVLVETFLLLFSSVTYGFVILGMHKGSIAQIQLWLLITFLFGLGFIAMELWEFNHLIHQGFGPDRSGFFSAFFGLIGTHGFHVTCGLVWILIMMIHVQRRGINATNKTRLLCLSLFWHFLDLVWVCVFSVVYLFGAI